MQVVTFGGFHPAAQLHVARELSTAPVGPVRYGSLDLVAVALVLLPREVARASPHVPRLDMRIADVHNVLLDDPMHLTQPGKHVGAYLIFLEG
jgi:hypothetical protein